MQKQNPEINEHKWIPLLSSLSSVARVRYSYAETALSVLVKGLPEMLMRQFEYEDPIVRGGKHLLHSAFFKELVALACDLVSLCWS